MDTKTRQTYTYHDERTLEGAMVLSPLAGTDMAQMFVVYVEEPTGDPRTRHTYVKHLEVQFEPLIAGTIEVVQPSNRAAHLIYEASGFVIEIVTSCPDVATIVKGLFSTDMHSTPLITLAHPVSHNIHK